MEGEIVNLGVMSFENGQCWSLSNCYYEVFPEAMGYSEESKGPFHLYSSVLLCILAPSASTRHVWCICINAVSVGMRNEAMVLDLTVALTVLIN